MTIGQRIAEQRKKCGYSQIYVAKKLSRILTAVLSAPAVIFLGFYAMELFGYGKFYINHWWWTAVCTLIYWASLGIYLLIKSKKITINSHNS